jgi:hypothetical protein
MRKQRIGERGQALVESALVTLTFLAMFIGIIDLGHVLFVHQSIGERARDTLREAVVQDFNAEAIRNKVLYGEATPPEMNDDSDDSMTQPAGFLGLEPSMIVVNRFGAGTTEDRVTLRVSRPPHQFYNPLMAKALETAPIVITLPYEGG